MANLKKSFYRKIDQINQWRMRKVSNRNFIIILAFVVGIVGGVMASVLKRLTHFIATSIQNDIDWKVKYSLYLVFPLIGILLSVFFVRKFIKGKKIEHGITYILLQFFVDFVLIRFCFSKCRQSKLTQNSGKKKCDEDRPASSMSHTAFS